MSRRKVRGLTRTGRQVSEDPDLDNLLSNLSAEDLEELEKEVVAAPPDLERNEGYTQSQPATNHNNRDVKLRDPQDRDTKKLSQRERSFEGEPKKETRKQEYLRKMGLSQEGTDDGIQVSPSVSSDQENKMEDRNNKGPGTSSKEDRASTSYRSRRVESKDNEVKEEMKEKESNEYSKLKEKRENRESTSSKTRDMILKLQEKKEDSREKERKDREDSRKSVDSSKTKGLISKLKEKDDKEKDRKEDVKKREENKARGLVSKMVEKQSQIPECKTEDKKTNAEEKSDLQVERQMSNEKESEGEKTAEKKDSKEKERETKQKENGKEDEKTVNEAGTEKKREKEENKGKDTNEGLTSSKSEELGNCVQTKDTPIKKTKEEEEDDEDASMFDELMEQVRSNDPSLLELNVNNSEVIKTKTLIQFAEVLHNNSHIKTLAFANCRADDHVAYAIAGTLRSNKTLTSINLDSNHLTPKGIIALIHALQHNATLTELRFHNQRHICGGKTEMEMTKVLKDNTTLLKLGYHFELAGPRMTMTNILSRNMDRQRQKRLQEQKLAQANGGGDKKGALEVPKTGKGFLRGSPRASPKPSPHPSPMPSPKLTPKRASGGGPGGGPPPPPPPPGAPPPPPPPMLDIDSLRNTLTPVSKRKIGDKEGSASGGKRDQLLASIRAGNSVQLKKVAVPKLLQ